MFKSTKTLVLAFAAVATMATTHAAAAAGKGSFKSHKKYSVSGTATLSASGKLTLSGFKTSSGPDLYVYVGNGSAKTRIAKLRKFSGSQTYKVPASIAKSATTVHIHCKRFSSTFGTARLR